jgi:hypothetical protein
LENSPFVSDQLHNQEIDKGKLNYLETVAQNVRDFIANREAIGSTENGPGDEDPDWQEQWIGDERSQWSADRESQAGSAEQEGADQCGPLEAERECERTGQEHKCDQECNLWPQVNQGRQQEQS